MKTPVIALVGRPNVGKSTLFNRLTRSRDALVADYAGLTRDRQYGRAVLSGHPFLLIDTGGLTGGEAGIDAAMAEQSKAAIDEADAVVFMVDAASGIAASDQTVADMLRRNDKPVWLVANKIDGQNADIALSDFLVSDLVNRKPLPHRTAAALACSVTSCLIILACWMLNRSM